MRSAGYRLSSVISADEMAKAVGDVEASYIAKMNPNYSPTSGEVIRATMALTFILLCQRATIVTRAGAKTKNTPTQSESARYTETDVRLADELLQAVNVNVKQPSKVVDDICGIYFRSFFN